jgi:hypothetical protein
VGSAEPVQFRVVWGDFSHGMIQEFVVAYDVDEALVVGHERHPELERPRTAFVVNDTD